MNALFPMPSAAVAGEIIVDSFAGGGGTSEGIRLAIGRDPDIAINHDKLALAMHRINHPGTHHMVEDVWHVDARGMCDGRPIGLLWLSPDCKHFSKAKGGKPREKAIRGLAWVGLRWVKSLPKRQRPRLVILENVEEFQDWGPLLDDGKPCPVQKGATFKAFIGGFEALGYKAEWRELRACDYGDPTIRKRLFVILRRDGKPIVWPERTHANPKDARDAPLIAAGLLKPWRTAAEIIDFTLPCPSIFETSAQIKASLGIRAQRPLKPNTMSRVAKGLKRYVIDAPRPFVVALNPSQAKTSVGNGATGAEKPSDSMTGEVSRADAGRSASATSEIMDVTAGETAPSFIVPVTHAGDDRVHGSDEPLRTITTARRGEHALITPFVTKFNQGSTGHAVDEPLATVTSHASETHGGGAAPLGVVSPILVNVANGRTTGRGPNTWPVDEPARTITSGNGHAVVAPILVGCGGRAAQSEPRPADEPAQTITAGGAKPAVVAAFLAQHNEGPRPGAPGRPVTDPVSTITVTGAQQSVITASFLSHAYTSNTAGGNGDIERPLKTTLAGGQHAALVAAFLAKYYGAGEPVQAADDPLHTVTAKPRHGLVTVTLHGDSYVITDIGMRMLTPRERFSAQGFRPDYIIDRGVHEDGSPVVFTLEQQGRMCGNSVCPGMARALVAANFRPAIVKTGRFAAAPILEAAE